MENKKYEYKDCLTNQMLSERYKNQFDLVRRAIKMAVQEVKSDRHGGYDDIILESTNIASKVLGEIASGEDAYFDENDCGCEIDDEFIDGDVAEFATVSSSKGKAAKGKKDLKKIKKK